MQQLITIPSFVFFFLGANLFLAAQPLDNNEICDLKVAKGFQPEFQIRPQKEEPEIVSATTPSQTKMTIPSLWWATERFDPLDGSLVSYWQANPQTSAIHVIVSNRSWRSLDYLQRYSFVNQLGTVAREYSYNLAIINQQQDCLAVYTCNLETTTPECNLELDGRRK